MRQMIGVIQCDSAQFGDQPRRDPHRLSVSRGADHPMPHRIDRREDRLRLEPVQEKRDGVATTCTGKLPSALRRTGSAGDGQCGAVRPDPLDFPGKLPSRRVTCLVYAKADAR